MMQTTLDLPDVWRFANDLNDRLSQCNDREQRILRDLDETIARYSQMCRELREFVNEWARGIMKGQIPCESAVENLLKTELRTLRERAKKIASMGRSLSRPGEHSKSLNELQSHILDFEHLLEHWITPQLSINPGPRATFTEEEIARINEQIKLLPPLPADWLPDDPEQRERFLKLRSK